MRIPAFSQPKPTLDIDMAEFRHMRNLMIKVQDKAIKIKNLQDKVLPQLKQHLADTKGLFKGKERKALEVRIKETEVEIADRLDKIPDTLKADGYPDVTSFYEDFPRNGKCCRTVQPWPCRVGISSQQETDNLH